MLVCWYRLTRSALLLKVIHVSHEVRSRPVPHYWAFTSDGGSGATLSNRIINRLVTCHQGASSFHGSGPFAPHPPQMTAPSACCATVCNCNSQKSKPTKVLPSNRLDS